MKSPSEKTLFSKFPNNEKDEKDRNSPEDYSLTGQPFNNSLAYSHSCTFTGHIAYLNYQEYKPRDEEEIIVDITVLVMMNIVKFQQIEHSR